MRHSPKRTAKLRRALAGALAADVAESNEAAEGSLIIIDDGDIVVYGPPPTATARST